mmetsp:Transcript_48922/g.76330  ORF Transcript_48922/g.76330 Transcript_48922/m.76330 type:complete len:357 (-) Transcript_48922:115-1185(-)|eukprot:CAMPEP_0184290824 /NCGR_PEP_ID=MMETSP1049-20130417/2978_1 /TAXON_ID=77928 /ORGANISM="Proteomonas sulcata, Strain CCMP704" /LENGTH=356 /DNA_ID=CAMNT_0026598079 /DNA_START=198 /DNA_END=1268 /DNA_ORIENTATION=-
MRRFLLPSALALLSLLAPPTSGFSVCPITQQFRGSVEHQFRPSVAQYRKLWAPQLVRIQCAATDLKQEGSAAEVDSIVAHRCRLAAAGRAIGHPEYLEDPVAEILAEPELFDLEDFYEENKPWSPVTALTVRAKVIDDVLVGLNPRQVVTVGAGLCTRPFRLRKKLAECQFIEADKHEVNLLKDSLLKEPETSELVASLGGDLVERVSIDFTGNLESLPDRLEAGGWCPHTPTVWVLEGLVYYLEKKDLEKLFKLLKGPCSEDKLLVTCVDEMLRDGHVRAGAPLRQVWKTTLQDFAPVIDNTGWKVESIRGTLSDLAPLHMGIRHPRKDFWNAGDKDLNIDSEEYLLQLTHSDEV